jgi:hypothetical protein
LLGCDDEWRGCERRAHPLTLATSVISATDH